MKIKLKKPYGILGIGDSMEVESHIAELLIGRDIAEKEKSKKCTGKSRRSRQQNQ